VIRAFPPWPGGAHAVSSAHDRASEILTAPDAVLDIPSIGFRCTVGEIYAGVPLPGEKHRPSPRQLE